MMNGIENCYISINGTDMYLMSQIHCTRLILHVNFEMQN